MSHSYNYFLLHHCSSSRNIFLLLNLAGLFVLRIKVFQKIFLNPEFVVVVCTYPHLTIHYSIAIFFFFFFFLAYIGLNFGLFQLSSTVLICIIIIIEISKGGKIQLVSYRLITVNVV